MAGRKDTKGKRSGRAKWVVVIGLGLAVFAGVETGWLGFGWATLRSLAYPRDDELLEWAPADTQAVMIIDPHRIQLRALGSGQNVARTAIERVASDVKRATGVDLGFDVDKLVVTPALAILRGRFDGQKLDERLRDDKYVNAEHAGHRYLVRPGDDALLVVDDDVIVYGQESAIQASIDAKAGRSLAKNDDVRTRLAQMGWDAPLLGTIALADDRPSLRTLIVGATGPRAITLGLRVTQGVDITAFIDTSTPTAGEELATLLKTSRPTASQALDAITGPDLAGRLGDVAKGVVIVTDPATGQVTLRAHISIDALDALIQAAKASAPLRALARTVRLFELLAPNP